MRKLIKFNTSWCSSCKQLSNVIRDNPPAVDEFLEVDIDEKPEFSRSFGINTVPTLVLINDDKEINRITGMCGPARLQQFVASV